MDLEAYPVFPPPPFPTPRLGNALDRLLPDMFIPEVNSTRYFLEYLANYANWNAGAPGQVPARGIFQKNY